MRSISVHRFNSSLLGATALSLALTGCGGGSSASHTMPAALSTAPASSMHTGMAQFALTIPTTVAAPAVRGRRPQYVSPSTQSASITVNATSTGFDLTAGSALCTTATNGRTCSLTVAAPIGSNTFTIALYQGTLSGNTPTGNLLSTSTVVRTIAEGSANVAFPVILGGVPASVDVQVAGLTAHMGSSGYSVPVYVNVYDAANNLIIGTSPYVNSGATAYPVHIATSIVTSEIALADPSAFSTAIDVVSPQDAPVLRFNGNQDILGVPFTVSQNGTALPAHTSTTGQTIAVSGNLIGTNIYQVGAMPDYTNLAPSDSSLGANVKNGFVFDYGYQGGAGDVGYFDSSDESVHVCTFGNSRAGVAPIDGGVATGYAQYLYADTTPWGLDYTGYGGFGGGVCPANSFRTDTVGDGVAKSLVYDASTQNLVEGTDNGGGVATAALEQVAYSAGAFSNLTSLLVGSTPRSLVVHNGYRFYEEQSNQIYRQTGSNGPSSTTVTGATITALAIGYDGTTYMLDSAHRTVYGATGTSAVSSAFRGAQFAFFPPTTPWALAIGPDGGAYSDDGTSGLIGQTNAISGYSATAVIPGYGGNTYIQGLFDGHNGYVYAFIETGSAGELVIDRISY